MFHKIKTLRTSAAFILALSGISLTEASSSMTQAYPKSTEGLALGFGAGVKLLNLKNVITLNPNTPGTIRSHDIMSNGSSPVLSLYARKYMPNLLPLPTFLGLEFDYLAGMTKTSMYDARITAARGGQFIDMAGFRYKEFWDARAMLGAQLWAWSQLDLWGQLGLQVTHFEYEGTLKADQVIPLMKYTMSNNFAFGPAGGLEVRFSRPNLFQNSRVVTDFIVGWVAGYRQAFKTLGKSPQPNRTFEYSMSANWSHTFGFKVLFRY